MKEPASERVEEILRGLYRYAFPHRSSKPKWRTFFSTIPPAQMLILSRSNTSFSKNQAPMLSHYLASPPTVVERVSNHLSPSPTAGIEKTADRYSRNCHLCTAGSGGRRNQELVTENDAYKMDPLWAELNELAQPSHTRMTGLYRGARHQISQ